MKRLILLSMLISVAAGAPAAGKGVQAVEVCGESECRSVPARDLRGHRAFDWVFGGGSGVGGEVLPAGAEVWRVAVTVGAGDDEGQSEQLHQLVAPKAGYIRLDVAVGGSFDEAMGASYDGPRWERMSVGAARKWMEQTKGIAPLDRPTPDRDDAGQEATAGDPAPAAPSTAGASDDSLAWPLVLAGGVGVLATIALWRRRSG